MKKIFLVAAGMLFTFQNYAQETWFGVTGRYLYFNVSTSAGIYDGSVNASGFYVGLLADVAFSDAFYLQPCVNYGTAEESSILSIPVLAKYYIAASGFNILAGSQAQSSFSHNSPIPG